MPKTYTVKEVADILGFSTNSIYTFLKEKRIKGVRVGKGRFRIPEDELKRILHLSKNTTSFESTPNTQIIPASPLAQQGDAAFIMPQSVSRGTRDSGVLLPNIFDWFVGLAAIVAGVGLFLFNSSVSASGLAKFASVFPLIRIVLIASGSGLILSSMLAQSKAWHRVFQFALAFMGFVNGFGLARNGDIEGALLYASIALVVAVGTVIPFGGVALVLIYASLIAICFPIVMIFFPWDTHVALFFEFINMTPFVVGVLSAVAAVLVICLFWVGYSGNRGLLILGTAFAAICDIAVAVWYANLQFWSRSFFLIVVGFFTALIPYWWPIQQQIARRYRLLLHGMFLVVGGVLLIAIFVVNLIQRNVWSVREAEFYNKIKIAQNQLENSISSTQSSLSVAAVNSELVEALAKPDLSKLVGNAKIIYESNPNIRRLVFLNEKGDGVALYPYGAFDEPNFGYRDYLKKVKETGKPYISDVFQAQADHISRQVVVVSVPVYSTKGEFIGVMAGSIDLDRVGLQLRQIAADRQGEYFLVVDSKGKILIHPDPALIGTSIPEADPITRGMRGEIGVVHGAFINKSYGMIAYADVPRFRWAISLRADSRNVYVLTTMTIWGVFGTVTIVLLTAILIIVMISFKVRYEKASGP